MVLDGESSVQTERFSTSPWDSPECFELGQLLGLAGGGSRLASSPCSITWMNMRTEHDIKKSVLYWSTFSSLHFMPHLKTTTCPRFSVALLQTLTLGKTNLGLSFASFWKVCSTQESKLTYDTQFCTGINGAVSVFCDTLIHAGVRQADIPYGQWALLYLNSALWERVKQVKK